MRGTTDPILLGAERLCETLERIGDALESIDTATLLDTEETLEQLLSALAAGGEVEDKETLKALARRAAAALAKCRRLGASFSGIAGTRLRLRTGAETYGRTGGFVEPILAGSTVKVMT
jgi:hypothetical protein